MILIVPISVVLISSLLLALKYKLVSKSQERKTKNTRETVKLKQKITNIKESNNVDRANLPLSIY